MADQMTAPDHTLAARLAPCPFCGGEGRYRLAYGIVCNGCNARLPSTYEDAVTEWNRRVPVDHTTAVQAAVAKAVEACGYNPRYIAYAHDNGRSAAQQMEIDNSNSRPPMAQFVAWQDRCLAMFKAVSPQSFTASGLKDAESFDYWLSRYGAPTFDNDADLLNRASIMADRIRMGDKISFGTDADLIDELSDAIRARKGDAL